VMHAAAQMVQACLATADATADAVCAWGVRACMLSASQDMGSVGMFRWVTFRLNSNASPVKLGVCRHADTSMFVGSYRPMTAAAGCKGGMLVGSFLLVGVVRLCWSCLLCTVLDGSCILRQVAAAVSVCVLLFGRCKCEAQAPLIQPRVCAVTVLFRRSASYAPCGHLHCLCYVVLLCHHIAATAATAATAAAHPSSC
jgi:hypothetical protein